ncbi:flavodoxin [Actinoplanes sp. CA-131856]
MTSTTTRRNFLALAAIAVSSVSAGGCSLLQDDESGPSEITTNLDAGRTLIAYLSAPETDDPDNMTADEENSTHVVDGKVLGNVQYLAQLIAARTGATTFRIETAEQLPRDHQTLEDLALRWQEQGVLPDLKALIPNLGDYDTIFIGYPIWWYDLPQPMYTFLEKHELGGKTVALFSVHGGSRLSGTDETITQRLADSTVVGNAFTISRDDMDSAEDEVNSWLDEVITA